MLEAVGLQLGTPPAAVHTNTAADTSAERGLGGSGNVTADAADDDEGEPDPDLGGMDELDSAVQLPLPAGPVPDWSGAPRPRAASHWSFRRSMCSRAAAAATTRGRLASPGAAGAHIEAPPRYWHAVTMPRISNACVRFSNDGMCLGVKKQADTRPAFPIPDWQDVVNCCRRFRFPHKTRRVSGGWGGGLYDSWLLDHIACVWDYGPVPACKLVFCLRSIGEEGRSSEEGNILHEKPEDERLI